MVSALNGDGVAEVKEELVDMALPMPWRYHVGAVTDQHPKDLVRQLVREKFLDRLPKRMPYELDIQITHWRMVDGTMILLVQVMEQALLST